MIAESFFMVSPFTSRDVAFHINRLRADRSAGGCPLGGGCPPSFCLQTNLGYACYIPTLLAKKGESCKPS